MATRCLIKVEGFNLACVYKHWDGSPASTLPWLEKFNKKFTEDRGDDPEYKFAQLLRSSVTMADEFKLDKSEETGWGVLPYGASSGQEFVYMLRTDGSITVEGVYEVL